MTISNDPTSQAERWTRFQSLYFEYPDLGLAVDLSRVNFPENWFDLLEKPMQSAYAAMAELEGGSIANPDENRMVGHYWLRDPELAPTHEIRSEIQQAWVEIEKFVDEIHTGKLVGASGPFLHVLIVGIGGSALGPQFVAHALGHPDRDRLSVHFFDNTDPDGMDKVLASLTGELGRTLCVVISKSGGTPETRNGMLEAQAAYERAELNFSQHAVAVTGEGSRLDLYAQEQGWLKRFPMWDWVGGRTSELSAVGLLPAALQGIAIQNMIAGARACDMITRSTVTRSNPAALLALTWYFVTDGRGSRDMVVLPYKDRLELFSKYLQQLVMESLGKELDVDGRPVYQGIAVYGNKGSTDQHAYVQQLREGVPNFFALFVEILKDRAPERLGIDVEPGITSGDYLSGLMLGTRDALYENGRQSLTLTLPEVSPFTVGLLIALFERAVGFYASLTRINAYHQPGVEAGKKAAASILALQQEAVAHLQSHRDRGFTALDLALALGQPGTAESLFKILNHLAANSRMVRRVTEEGVSSKFQAASPTQT
jgi:glucose-6-phosphate isomerase